MLDMAPLPKVITFDCRGTLVQWHKALLAAAGSMLTERADGVGSSDIRVTEVGRRPSVSSLATLITRNSQVQSCRGHGSARHVKPFG